ncbi:sulfite exporter TauE/SafE family protein [Shewanella sp. Scap07]|uniref:sulfite exporter TauE/SafE family protein n=1 Tax=Shewanella sp. Scap07 TaxID=2589987 RepID=UPI0015B89926|nr:sulfite exporter TauE/SafE family protein [Shewanella sp. Scap07]QLE85590.1 sulfite exporter TauE/SafE family protein [Shewanella sp. Scap07]
MNEYSYTAAFIVGLMGAGHCMGMCGGIVGAFSQQLPKVSQGNVLAHRLRFLLAYNIGRISSYGVAGALVGGSASLLGLLFDIDVYLLVLRFIAGVMMIITGLYIAQVWSGVVQIERLGQWIWRFLSPIAQRLLPIQSPIQAGVAGIIWGWLPCGLVYSTLTWAVASNSALHGAAIMLCFGLGTLPALLSAGLAADMLNRWVRSKWVKWLSGSALVAFGCHTLYIGFGQLN